MALFDRLKRLAQAPSRIVRRARDILRRTPSVPPPPPPPQRPPQLPPGPIRPQPFPESLGDSHNSIGFPPYMGEQEANQLAIGLSSLPPPLAAEIRTDDNAMRGYHWGYFGFKGDEFGNDAEPRRNLIGYRREFLDYMAQRYNIDFERDMPIDWDLLRALSGAEAPDL